MTSQQEFLLIAVVRDSSWIKKRVSGNNSKSKKTNSFLICLFDGIRDSNRFPPLRAPQRRCITYYASFASKFGSWLLSLSIHPEKRKHSDSQLSMVCPPTLFHSSSQSLRLESGPSSLRVRVSWTAEILKSYKLCPPRVCMINCFKNFQDCTYPGWSLQSSRSLKEGIAWCLLDRKAVYPALWLPSSSFSPNLYLRHRVANEHSYPSMSELFGVGFAKETLT